MDKAAIIIGVDQTSDLPPLKAARQGAERVGHWLTREGFVVYPFLDAEGQAVAVKPIFRQIRKLVKQGTLEQLVIFFSGHGFQHNYGEIWLLSDAPEDPNEAISVLESVELARRSGIPNVVLISDACRSTPDSLRAGSIRGSLIFPNEPVSAAVSPKVDRFIATLAGRAAYEAELPVTESSQAHAGLFTQVFLKAYQTPYPDMILRLGLPNNPLDVVPNRRLEAYLRREVPLLAERQSVRISQIPEVRVESDDEVYIARVQPGSLSFPTAPPPRAVVDAHDLAQVEIARAISAPLDLPAPVVDLIEARAVDESDFDRSVARVQAAQSQARDHFETNTGFTIVGARVVAARAYNDDLAELVPPDSQRDPSLVRLKLSEPVASVILRFADGTGTVVAGIREYIGTILVEAGRVTNVSYVPSRNSYLWDMYESQKERLERLRALVAAAADQGVFRVDRQNAGHLARHIRILKGIDPTLGLYAAYAYADVGLQDQVTSLLGYMENDISARLFDVAMLANERAEARLDRQPAVVPFCPMLAQGWSLLRVKDAKIPAMAERARDHLLPALWTTFDPTGMAYLEQVFDEGGIL